MLESARAGFEDLSRSRLLTPSHLICTGRSDEAACRDEDRHPSRAYAGRVTRYALLSLLLACGSRTGLPMAVDAGERPDVPPREPETCNGIDDDLDGRIDEDVESPGCGIGACERRAACVDGVLEACVPGAPAPEACNARDDDCDGVTDEDLGFGPLGPVRELRETTGSGGSCTSCNWAWDTTLSPTDEGYLLFWRVGISGGMEVPNTWARRLALDGTPLGEVEPLGEQVILDVRHLGFWGHLPTPVDALHEVTLRIGSDDRPHWFQIDPRTRAPRTERRPYMLAPDCRAALIGETVWTGSQLVSVCWDEEGVHAATVTPEGVEVSRRVMPLPDARGGNVAVYEGEVGIRSYVVHDRDDRYVTFARLDRNGEVLQEPRRVDLEYASWARLLATPAGWLHLVPQFEQTRWQLLSREGDPLTELVPFEDGRRMGDSPLQDFQRAGPSGVLNIWQNPYEEGSDLYVEFLGPRGEITRQWHGPVGPWVVSPHARIRRNGNVSVAWHGLGGDGVRNDVFFLELGCLPDE